MEEESKEEPVASEVPEESEPQKEDAEVVKTVSQLKTEKRRQRKKKEEEGGSDHKKAEPEDLFTFEEGQPADAAPTGQEQNSASLLEMDDQK